MNATQHSFDYKDIVLLDKNIIGLKGVSKKSSTSAGKGAEPPT